MAANNHLQRGAATAKVPEPIAIVGIGCRFPGSANTPESFWKNLCEGLDSVSEVPSNRWSIASYYDPQIEALGKTNSKWIGVVDGIDQFDYSFFGISPREAATMDPQQRMMLEAAYEAIEDSGHTLAHLQAGRTGVYVGAAATDYASLQAKLDDTSTLETYSNSGGALSIIANRISFCFDLNGPSISLDTACSSAMNAIVLACQSLWSGDCTHALAGGVNIALTPLSYIGFTKLSMLSPEGRCRAFDANGNGYVRSEAAAVIHLKRLSDARANGDRIYATIQGAAANQDGHTSAMLVPGEDSQAAMIEMALASAGIQPDAVQYVEAHGTGTVVGDQIEAQALGRALGKCRTAGSPVLIGSVKTNIGHTECAAGVAGVIKAALSIYHRKIPANLHFQTPNPAIDFDGLNLRVVTALQDWPTRDGEPRLACVNSFGFGGANAHVVLSSVDDPASVTAARPDSHVSQSTNGRSAQKSESSKSALANEKVSQLFPISGRSANAVRQRAAQWREACQPDQNDQSISLDDLGHNLAHRQTHHEFRAAIVAESHESLMKQLDTLAQPNSTIPAIFRAEPSGKIAFVFSGQGPQWWGMGRELMSASPVFRSVIESCDRSIRGYSNWSLIEELSASEDRSRMNETAISQPAIFAVQVALCRYLESLGVKPDAVVGHSVGEIAAAHIAGVYDLATATRIIFHRGRCMDRASSRGAMLAVGLNPIEAAKRIEPFLDRVCVASFNSPTSVTLSGERAALEKIAGQLGNDVFHRFLQVEYAFHSNQMEPLRDELIHALRDIRANQAAIPMASTVTGDLVAGEELNAEYWWQNVRQSVRFSDGISCLHAIKCRHFVEISPHPVLRNFVAEVLNSDSVTSAESKADHAHVVSTLRRYENDMEQVLRCIGELFGHGLDLDWSRLQPKDRRFLKLPTYPWQHESCWSENDELRQLRLGIVVHPFLGRRLKSAEPIWEVELNAQRHGSVWDHVIQGHVLFPAAGFIEIGFAVAREIFGSSCCVLEEVDLHRAAFIPQSGKHRLTLQTVFDPHNSRFRVFGRTNQADSTWVLFVSGTIIPERPNVQDYCPPARYADAACDTLVTREQFYRKLADSSFQYGPSFQCVQKCWRDDVSVARAKLEMPQFIRHEIDQYHCHPGMLDSGIQVFSQAMGKTDGNSKLSAVVVPVHIDRIVSYGPFGENVHCRVDMTWQGISNAKANYQFESPDGEPLLGMWGFSVQAVDASADGGFEGLDNLLYDELWQLEPLPSKADRVSPVRYLPAATSLAKSLEDEMSQFPSYRWIDACPNFVERLDAIAVGFAVRSLKELGWAPLPGDHINPAQLIERLGIRVGHRWYVDRIMRACTDRGWLAREGDNYIVLSIPNPTDPESVWQKVLADFPAALAELTMLASLGRRLTDVLAGRLEALEIPFPHGSHDTAEHFYQDSPTYRFSNQLAARAVTKALESFPAGRILRVLEIGAGTGATTRYVLPQLPFDQTRYCFTDISSVFFSRAKQKLADFPFVEYRVFNLEVDPADQDLPLNSFDLVIALDAVHATKDLRTSLRHIRRLLAPGGMLVMIEIDRVSDWIDLNFGLLEGWTRFSDFDLRTDSPLMPRWQWLDLFRQSGFNDSAAVSEIDQYKESGHSLYLARPDDDFEDNSDEKVDADKSKEASLERNDAEIDNGSFESPTRASNENGFSKSANGSVELSGKWIVFMDDRGTGEKLANQLVARGAGVTCITIADQFTVYSDSRYAIRPDSTDDMRRLLQLLWSTCDVSQWTGVLHCWSLVSTPFDQLDNSALVQAERRNCHSLLNFARIWSELEANHAPRIWVITSGTQPVGRRDRPLSMDQVPILGLARTLANELPKFCCRMIDLDAECSAASLTTLLEELVEPNLDEEIEVALHDGARFVPRMIRSPMSRLGSQKYKRAVCPRDVAFRLEIETPGILDRLVLRETARRTPGPGEVEIRVKAAGLNFRDVMKAMGIYPTELNEDLWLGDECSGIVSAVGSDVAGFSVGDSVVAFAPGAFGSYLVASPTRLFAKPERLRFDESATIAAAFITAYYALRRMGQISTGDKVLVQTATGGVGLAAVQIAKHFGAEVIATAGTPAKRELLQMMGVKHIFDSRSLRFSDQVRAVTGGCGVDIVLNALAGQAIEQGLRSLAPHGRFLEIGKRDIYANNRIGLRCFKDNLSFISIDMEKVFVDRPEVAAGLWNELRPLFESGKLTPLPHRVFPTTDALGCFRSMAQAKHIGKLVLSFDDPDVAVLPAHCKPFALDKAATYCVVGGFSGFGAQIAKWLVQRGARNVVLISRRGEATPGASDLLNELGSAGANVMAVCADVTDSAALKSAIQQIVATCPPLKGVIMSVMDLADGTISNMSPERFHAGTRSKLLGAWNLHCTTKNLPLEFFLMFSSFATVMGNPGQSNYAAANAFIDRLAYQRRQMGLPANVIDWGPLEGMGHITDRPELIEYYKRLGFEGVNLSEATRIIEQVLSRNIMQAAAIDINWPRVTSGMFIRKPARFSRLVGGTDSGGASGFGRIRDTILAAKPGERLELLSAYLAGELGSVLGRAATEIDADTSLVKLGIDSLMTVELKNRIEQETVVSLPIMELMNGPSLRKLAEVVLSQIEGNQSATKTLGATNNQQQTPTPEDAEKLLARVDELPESEVDRLLATLEEDTPSAAT